jgi:hypothetical protein
MEIYYVSVIVALAAFSFSGIITFLVFRGDQESQHVAGPEAAARRRDLCYECLGSSNLESDSMSQCVSACGTMLD